jgi:hypothetical protein
MSATGIALVSDMGWKCYEVSEFVVDGPFINGFGIDEGMG